MTSATQVTILLFFSASAVSSLAYYTYHSITTTNKKTENVIRQSNLICKDNFDKIRIFKNVKNYYSENNKHHFVTQTNVSVLIDDQECILTWSQ